MLAVGLIFQSVLAWLAVGLAGFYPVNGRRALLVLLAGVILLLLGVSLGGYWVYPPAISLFVPWALLVFLTFRRLRGLPRSSARPGFFTVALSVLLGSLGAMLLWQVGQGRSAPDTNFVELVSPFERDAGFCVVSGGNSLLLNLHFLLVSDPTSQGEVHALDFIRLNRWGLRTDISGTMHPQPKQVDHYEIYDQPVFAPCAGIIESVVIDKPDHSAGHKARQRDGANMVVMQCNSAEVVMVHFAKGSIGVSAGDAVQAGDFLGRVGNSGNTEEPHLHLHAQSMSAENGVIRPYPIKIDGRYLARDDCV